MKGRRHSPEQIVRKLREADRLLAEGADVDAVCRHLEISVQSYQRWRAQYRAMRVARLDRDTNAQEQAKVDLLVNTGRLHFFDPETGDAIYSD
jgi:transposase